MSKGNFLMNTVAGKLGSMVFMRRKGQQITRTLVKPTDAKTRAQGAQRSSLSNIIRLYQSSPDFFKRAFENRPSNQSDYNALVSRNLTRMPRVCLPKEVAANGGGVVAPYIISDGSLQPILTTGQGVQVRTNIAVGDGFVIDETTTIGDLTAAILSLNTFIQEGDQISYLSVEQYTSGGYPRLRTRKYELKLVSGSSLLVRDYLPVQATAVSGGYLAHGAYVYSGAFAWILSRNSNQSLKVSRQSLIVTSEDLYTSYVGAAAATRAAASYGNTNEVFLSPNYTSEGSVVPSNLPSIADVRLNNVALNPGDNKRSLPSSLPVGYIAISGSNLDTVEELILIVYSGDPAVQAAQVAVPMSEGTTSKTSSAVVTLPSAIDATRLVLTTSEGQDLFDWTYTHSSLDDNPLG